MSNTSGLHPVGHRLLIQPTGVEEVTAGGIIISKQTVDQERLAQMTGRVIEVGTTAYADQPSAWCKVGDIVTFGKYSGLIYKGAETKDKCEYRIINDLDVVAVHEE
jgi:co-chaperonin GroES (HSP10)